MKNVRRSLLILLVASLLVCLEIRSGLGFVNAFANDSISHEKKFLNITTLDTKSISIDRLLYATLKDIGLHASFTAMASQIAFDMVNDGQKDGFISATPDMEEVFTNLVKVDVPLTETLILTLSHIDSDLEITDWNMLSGLKIGIVSQRPFSQTEIPEDAELFVKNSKRLLFQSLSDKEIDIAILTPHIYENIGLTDSIRISGQLGVITEYLYLNNIHKDIVPDIEEALRLSFEEGRAQEILNNTPPPGVLSDRQTILHIVSDSTELEREDRFTRSLKEQFRDDNLEWYSIALSSKHFSMDQSRMSYFAQTIRQSLVPMNAAAIVVSGPEALAFVKDYYFILFENVPVLFYGVDDKAIENIDAFIQYYTGITDRTFAYDTVSTALSLFPNTENIFVLNDYTLEGISYRNNIEDQLRPFNEYINIKHNDNVDFNTILSQIIELPENSMVLVGSYFRDANGRYYSKSELTANLEISCDVPVFALYSSSVAYDAVGGKFPDYIKYSDIIGNMIRQLLDGESTENIPIVDSSEYGKWVFDKIVMDRCGIRESSLPPDSQIINAVPSIWESNPELVYVVIAFSVLVVIAAIANLFINRYKKQKERLITTEALLKKDAKIKEVKERLERIINTAPIAYMLTIDGVIIEANEYMKNHVGVEVGENASNYYTNSSQRNYLVWRASQQSQVSNEVVKFNMVNDDPHRFLATVTSVEYDQQTAYILWGMDTEESETQKDQLSIAQQSLQTILDTMPAPVSIINSESLEIVYCNNAYLNLLEFDSHDAPYGKKIYENMIIETEADLTDSDKLEEFVVDLLKSSNFEVQNRTDKGKIVDVRIQTSPIIYNEKKSTICIITDLTSEIEYKRMQESLRTILDLMPIPIRMLDVESYELIYVNNALAEMFSVGSPENIIGRSVSEFMPKKQPDGTASMQKHRSFNKSEEPVSAELLCIKENGEQFYAHVTACLIDYNGKKSSLGILTDLTAKKEYERMLLNMAEKEKEAHQLKSRFLVNMSHEIRTPMNAIIGLTEIELRKGINLGKEVKGIYKKINSSAKNLLNIINDILDMSKIEADKIELYIDEFELESVLSGALFVATPRLDGKNVEFMLNASLDLPRFVKGDRTRLWQILKNFLDNSAKFTDEGKIVLTVFVNNEKSDDKTIYLTFIIEDTGIGINEEQLQKMFMPYAQIYSEAQKRYNGTGLGMPISKKLCEIMGGTLDIDSKPGKGTIIRLCIPFERADNSATELETVSNELKNVNILAVDDDELSLLIMSTLLNSGNANCELARSGEDAMRIIYEYRDKGKKFDIILLDYMMKGLTGLETARQIQTSLSNVPKLLMVTAYQRLLLKHELEKNGILDVIEKPFIPSQFIRKIKAALNSDLAIDISSDNGYDDYEFEKENEGFTKFEGVTILLFEDYRLNQEVATGMFSQFGISSVIAENGVEGVEILQSGRMFDLIFMDLHMPIMDGYEASSIIRKDKRFDNIPIISLTADAMKEVSEKCFEAGMNDYITKPIEFSELQRIFTKWLPESKRIATSEPNNAELNTSNMGLLRFGGNKELYRKALREFANDLPTEWPGFVAAIQEAEKTKEFVHRIKGSAGNLSEMDIYQFATDFESSLRKNTPDRETYRRLANACESFKNRIAKQETESGIISLKVGTAQAFEENLNRLKDALLNYDLKKCSNAIEILKEKEWPMADEEKLTQLYNFVEGYDYMSALDVLDSI